MSTSHGHRGHSGGGGPSRSSQNNSRHRNEPYNRDSKHTHEVEQAFKFCPEKSAKYKGPVTYILLLTFC